MDIAALSTAAQERPSAAVARTLSFALPLLYAARMTSLLAAATGATLPRSFWQAIQRGASCKCPRCNEARLFRKWLKPVDTCPTCAQDWSMHRADDFPAYIAILVAGHLLAPVMIAMTAEFDMSPGAILAVLVPLSVALMLGMLQPAKGAVIAAQWWHGLHGFRKERLPEPDRVSPE